MTDFSKVKAALEKNGFRVNVFSTGTEADNFCYAEAVQDS